MILHQMNVFARLRASFLQYANSIWFAAVMYFWLIDGNDDILVRFFRLIQIWSQMIPWLDFWGPDLLFNLVEFVWYTSQKPLKVLIISISIAILNFWAEIILPLIISNHLWLPYGSHLGIGYPKMLSLCILFHQYLCSVVLHYSLPGPLQGGKLRLGFFQKDDFDLNSSNWWSSSRILRQFRFRLERKLPRMFTSFLVIILNALL